jgi:hypothetical protein
MDSISKDQWREFHYGKKQQQPKRESKETWTLYYNNQPLIKGNYSLCVWKMKQVIALEGGQRNLFKIK